MVQCPHCHSNQTVKNGGRNGTQSYLCHSRCRQFRETYTPRGYPSEVKEHYLKLYLNGMGLRAIERVTAVCHNTVINWVKQASQALPDEDYEIPETTQVDELYSCCTSGAKRLWAQKFKLWLWIVANSKAAGIVTNESAV